MTPVGESGIGSCTTPPCNKSPAFSCGTRKMAAGAIGEVEQAALQRSPFVTRHQSISPGERSMSLVIHTNGLSIAVSALLSG